MTTKHNCKGSIFVSIPSYRDPELVPTLNDLIHSSHNPERLHIAVCLQDENLHSLKELMLLPDGETEGYATYTTKINGATIWVIFMHYSQSRGAGLARHLCETRYNDESYFLQIDSHCRFISGWDEEMINMLESLRHKSDNPILSTYPPDYQPGEPEQRASFTSRLIFREFTADGLSMQDSYPFQASEPQRNCYLAGGFVFAGGDYVKNVPNDPNIFFYGEEISMAVRAFTHGYDAYVPHKILLWHHYGRAGSPKIWDDHTDRARTRGEVTHTWYERDQISKLRVCAVLGLREPLSGLYGCGALRSLADFTRVSGLCFKTRKIHPDVKGQKRCSYFDHPGQTEDTWLAAFVAPDEV